MEKSGYVDEPSSAQDLQLPAGDDSFGEPERAHKLVYRIHENQWERVETTVLVPQVMSCLYDVGVHKKSVTLEIRKVLFG